VSVAQKRQTLRAREKKQIGQVDLKKSPTENDNCAKILSFATEFSMSHSDFWDRETELDAGI